MKINVILFLALLFNACKPANKINNFVEKYHLENYDTICAISCISCGGCIKKYVTQRENSKNTLFIFDDNCKSDFIENIKHVKHTSISQKILDSMFNDFGNIMLITKHNGEYVLIEKGTSD